MGRHPQMRRRPLAAEPIAVWWMLLLRARTRIVTAAESEVETVGEESGTLKGKESWAMALPISSRERKTRGRQPGTPCRPPSRTRVAKAGRYCDGNGVEAAQRRSVLFEHRLRFMTFRRVILRTRATID